MNSVLITGGAGFAGAHLCEHILHKTCWDVIVLDRLTYAGSLERLRDVARDFGPRLKVVYHDFRAAFPDVVLRKLDGVRYVIHNGAETHVDNSLRDPLPFVESNVLGTMHVLDACRKLRPENVIYVSTDEVHGPAPDGIDFREDAPMRPSNPYSASKVGGEALAFAYWRSFALPVTITRTMNLIGERQHPEKFVPMTLGKVLRGEEVTLHGTTKGRLCSRKWIHARNQADALLWLLREHGAMREDTPPMDIVGQMYHIAGEERTVLEVAQWIAEAAGRRLLHRVVDVEQARPGHDLRYSLDDSKLAGLGWKAPVPLRESLVRTVEWTIRHGREWL